VLAVVFLVENYYPNPAAQFLIGYGHEWGIFMKKNQSIALQWYKSSAEQNYAPAEYRLGVAYDRGKGVGRNPKVAVAWYRRSAEHGYAIAQNNLAAMYSAGDGVQRDLSESLKWFRMSAAQGELFGIYNVGRSYETGEGVEQDPVEAVKWYRLALELRDNWEMHIVRGAALLKIGTRLWHGIVKPQSKGTRSLSLCFRMLIEPVSGLGEMKKYQILGCCAACKTPTVTIWINGRPFFSLLKGFLPTRRRKFVLFRQKLF
jgi:TPR repeat protein